MNTDAQNIASDTSAAASRREILIGGALLGTAALSAIATRSLSSAYPKASRPLEELIPHTVGPWSKSSAGGLLIPKGEETEGQPYDEVVTRYYTQVEGPAVMLLVAYGSAQSGTAQLHRPEVCYPAAGFKMRRWPDLALQAQNGRRVTARVMTATAPGRIEQILYWSRVGDTFPTDTNGQRWAVLKATLSGAVPDGVLVRLSVIQSDRKLALDSLRAFGHALLGVSQTALRPLLTGAS